MGSRTRGRIDVVAPRSRSYQGPFGRIFADLPPWNPPGVEGEPAVDAYCLQKANELMVELPAVGNSPMPSPGDIAAEPGIPEELDRQFGSKIPAAYTYFGQFIDHDMTFDTASSLQRENDPNALLNFRTPRLDLDNIYGRGPADQPYMYDESPHDRAKFLIGNVGETGLRDLPRNSRGRALIGDMRNDENSMVAQVQLAFLLAHNELVDRAVAAGSAEPFNEARRTLRWLYQWIVWNDWIKRIAIDEVYKCALSLDDACGGRKVWNRGLKDVYNWSNQPFMPIEFSVAAYRFGHSMVRNSYETNHPHRGAGVQAPIFDNSGSSADPDDLRGFRPLSPANVIQWDWFLHMGATPTDGEQFPQKARKIDTKLANSLTFLHEAAAGDRMNVLAYRNLKRSWTFQLPSGTDVATHLCVKPVAMDAEEPDALWYYILKEAETLPGANRGQMMGRVGSIITCATFAGLLAGDPQSYFSIAPSWTPSDSHLLVDGQDNVDDAGWSLESIIRLSGMPVDATEVSDQT